MTARDLRGILTIDNIVEACDEMPHAVFTEMQSIVDADGLDLPDEVASVDNIIKLQALQAYYANQYPYIVGLWGVMKNAASGQRASNRTAMKDYLEKIASACSKKYDGASRLLTGYQETMKEPKARVW